MDHQSETVNIIAKFILNDLRAILRRHQGTANPLPPAAVWLIARGVQAGIMTKRDMRRVAERWILSAL
jgi:hypothetical protein